MGARIDCDGVRVRREHRLAELFEPVRVLGEDGDTPDVLAFDSSLHRLYVSAESGDVAVFAEHPHGLKKLGQAMLAPHAHTVAVDSRTHLVYFPLESGSTGKRQLLIMAPS
jgi:hypothetical protein